MQVNEEREKEKEREREGERQRERERERKKTQGTILYVFATLLKKTYTGLYVLVPPKAGMLTEIV